MAIKTAELKPKDIGRWVEYKGSAGESQLGRIKSYANGTVKVVYLCDGNWWRFRDYTGEMTLPAALTFVMKPDNRELCDACGRYLPPELLSPFVASTDHNYNKCCGVCALMLSNYIHEQSDKKFQGEGAEYNRTQAIRFYQRTRQPV